MRLPTPTQTPKKLGFFITYVFPWPFLIVGIVMLGFGLRSLRAARASASWPVADGTVTSSEVERSTSRSSSGKRSARTTTTYHAKVKYRYSVGGQSHEGDRVAFGDYGSSKSSHAREIAARYPVGIKVDVFHAPDSPDQSVLEPGLKGPAFILPGMGTVFTIIGLAMLISLPIAARRAAKRYNEALGADQANA